MLFAYLFAGLTSGSALQPTGKWIVEFADNACILSRRYGSGDDFMDIHFKAAMIGKGFEVVIASPEKRSSDEEFDKGWIERPDGSKVEPIYFESYSSVSKNRLTRALLDPELYVLGSDGERLILHVNEKRSYDLALPDLSKALKVVDDCSKGLRKDHGIGDEVMTRIATPAKPRQLVNKWFSTNDYPASAVRNGEQGNVGVLFWVETDGRVRECKVIETSHREALDAQTCNVIVYRARYSPAQDSAGTPIRSPLYQRIHWRMPG